MANEDLERVLQPHEARVNVTWQGQNGELRDPIRYDASDEEIKRMVTEAVRGGDVPGIANSANANFDGCVVERFPANRDVPYNKVMLRPKTEFGW